MIIIEFIIGLAAGAFFIIFFNIMTTLFNIERNLKGIRKELKNVNKNLKRR